MNRLERGDGREPGLVVDERELAENIAWVADAEQHLAPVRSGARDLHPAGQQQHHSFTGLVLEHQHRPAREAAAHAESVKRVTLLPIQQR